MSNIKIKTKTYRVRKGYVIKKMNFEYLAGCIVELTEDEAKNKYSHQIEAIAVDPDKKIKDIADNKAIKKNTVTKK